MHDDDQGSRGAGTEPVKVKPEEQGRPVPSTGQALEPEALHPAAGSAAATGDKMWGPSGEPEEKSD